MPVPIVVRCSNLRNLLKINNNIVGVSLNRARCSQPPVHTPLERTAKKPVDEIIEDKGLNKAMQAYLNRAKKYESFVQQEMASYDNGRRHLANIMGVDPENFTQADIDKSIEYLFPSGLFEPKARPMMKHPSIIFPPKKEAAFDTEGKPYHPFFFTRQPKYYEALYNITEQIQYLDNREDEEIKSTGSYKERKYDHIGSGWMMKVQIEKLLSEKITDDHYEYLIKTLTKLSNHHLSNYAKDFIEIYRNKINIANKMQKCLPILEDEQGKRYVVVHPCQRKSAVATVKVWENGTGNITINGKDIGYFEDFQCREQIIFPLIFTNMAERVDIEATVEGGGPTGQSGAIRWGIAWGLRSFVPSNIIDNMKVAGLLTRDWRRRERKKFGQEGARRKFTWKKR